MVPCYIPPKLHKQCITAYTKVCIICRKSGQAATIFVLLYLALNYNRLHLHCKIKLLPILMGHGAQDDDGLHYLMQ